MHGCAVYCIARVLCVPAEPVGGGALMEMQPSHVSPTLPLANHQFAGLYKLQRDSLTVTDCTSAHLGYYGLINTHIKKEKNSQSDSLNS